MPSLPKLSFAAVILAAGASSRMGSPKVLLPWAGTTVIGYLIEQWKDLGAEQIVIVMAPGAEALEEELDRLAFPSSNRIVNPAPELGMFSSIQSAARWSGWKKGLSHWVIALGDQPHLQSATLLALLGLGVAHPENVCQLSRRGRPRHPVWLPAAGFGRLRDTREADLKHFLRTLPLSVALEESDDAGLDLDLDEPSDYAKALQLFGQKNAEGKLQNVK